MKINSENAFLLFIDVQERLLPAMHEPQRILNNCRVLMQAGSLLGLPILVSEQYPKGLGPTVSDLASLVPPSCVRSKIHFSCLGDDALANEIAGLGRRQAVVCGIESHVCVTQTALDLVADGKDCFVVGDATSSRDPSHVPIALDRLRGEGAKVVVTEQVLFECLDKAGTNLFKEVTALIK